MGVVGNMVRGTGCLVVIGAVLVFLLMLSVMGVVPIDPKIIVALLGAVIFIIVALIVALAVGLFFLKKFILKFFGDLGKQTTPAEIHVHPAADLTWQDADTAMRAQEQFRQAGFDDLGMFRIEEIPATKLRAFLHLKLQFWGIVYEHEGVGVWSDVVAHFLDRRSATYTNAKMGDQLDHRPGHDKHYHPGTSVTELISRCENGSTGKPM